MIAVLDYGIGNLGSAYKALRMIGASAALVDARLPLKGIDGVILPGVGSFGACVSALRSHRLDSMLFDAVENDIPVLGICVGMQMLYENSEESPDMPGLGLFAGQVKKISGAPKLPHMSWNQIHFANGGGSNPLFDGIEELSWFYFVHSFAPELTSTTVATCEYGDGFTAVVSSGKITGTQFHPEKSSTIGLALLSNFVMQCYPKVVG